MGPLQQSVFHGRSALSLSDEVFEHMACNVYCSFAAVSLLIAARLLLSEHGAEVILGVRNVEAGKKLAAEIM